ncbi:MAG: PAS domain S-box protein [Deltaproteobacteria bacterium]|jgi:PAS domain S-box-containing protein|nr:PAS domain S-box protein [Deltaproteobacteria bacterium]
MAGEIEPIEYYENPVLTKIGEERIIAWHNTILKDDEGRISGTLSSGEDITEQKRTEVALQEAYNIINRSPGTGRPPLSKIC